MIELAPSLLSADFSRLAEEVKCVEDAGAHLLHIDVMDGHFVPNISYGAVVMKSLLGKTRMPFDVHLMIENPDRYIEDFMTDNTEYIVVHQEACVHLNRVLQQIRGCGAKTGVALNPATPIDSLEYVLADVDLVLVMSVNPGFGGQKLIPSAIQKINQLYELRNEFGLKYKIEVDGGINLDNVSLAIDAGADIIVAGSSLFHAEDTAAWVKDFTRRYSEVV